MAEPSHLTDPLWPDVDPKAEKSAQFVLQDHQHLHRLCMNSLPSPFKLMESDYVETSPGSGVLQHYANGSSKTVGFSVVVPHPTNDRISPFWRLMRKASCCFVAQEQQFAQTKLGFSRSLDENWLAGGIVHYVVHPTVADMTIAEFQADIGGSSTVSGKTMDAMTIAAAPNCIKPVLAALRTHVSQCANVDPTRALVSSMVHDNLALRQFSLDDAMKHEDLCWYLYCATLQTTFSLGALHFLAQVNDFLVECAEEFGFPSAEVKTDKPSHPASSEPTMRT
ncbi:hypothetical protein CAOG_06115 [Capsaspora owczarzaki ATCC 30864]|uniref:Uncharacterized protein n=1 Tax=Capsaspora owczarzaki (strain ATCC 30864) TaxID=595528 RepID=A0A0D2WUM5_CAPO3|nr:hypothetical protein CAOG_06115 [Capsaspora owczarzaki ATCC 30864]KJE95688.1 hypothetical protein CAOG_006115 [Capsaspora owczarzaki ATCC 30864]|eukprot:XP_004345705.2 hypothetical protein CAOG_06115 [Capsaspora owczarzaki ATCC 30864]